MFCDVAISRPCTPEPSLQQAAGRVLAPGPRVAEQQNTVYIVRSTPQPWRCYTGKTSNLGLRLRAHNRGLSRYTALGRPWQVVVSMTFANAARATEFESYLKSGSGKAFAKRHLR